jgi:hypothetical protein
MPPSTIIDEGERVDLRWVWKNPLEDLVRLYGPDPSVPDQRSLTFSLESSSGVTLVADTHTVTGRIIGLRQAPPSADGRTQTYELAVGLFTVFDQPIATVTRRWPPGEETDLQT